MSRPNLNFMNTNVHVLSSSGDFPRSIAHAARVTYPAAYQDSLSAIDFINFGSVLGAACLCVDFHDRLVVGTVGPLLAMGFLAMTFRIVVRRNGGTPGDAAIVAEKIYLKHLAALLLLAFLVYSSVSSMLF